MFLKRAAARTPAAVLAADTPAEAGVPPLALGIALSILVHAFVLALHFTPDLKPKQKAKDQALEVILVNARSRQKPIDPQALAQANLDGGGTVDQDRRASTPLPVSPREKTGDQLVDTQRRVQELESQQQKLLSELKSGPALNRQEHRLEQPDPTPEQKKTLTGDELAASAAATARNLAAIARNVDDYNKKPRKAYALTRTQEYAFARYIDDWRQKIERIGSLNYPPAARGKVYGNVTLTVEIRQDGEVASIALERSSGHKVLDDAAIRIVRMAAPYPSFPDHIRREYDILSITRTLIFARGDLVESN